MKIGFITNSFTDIGIHDITEIASWAKQNGFSCLEVGPAVPLDQKTLTELKGKSGVDISAFIYCRNFLSNNLDEAETYKKELINRINMAGSLGVKRVICSTGLSEKSFDVGNPAKFNPEQSIPLVAELFKQFAEVAEKKNVLLCYENCPLMGNVAISPYMWDLLFEKIGSDRVGLVFDPSHLAWQFIDPYKALFNFRERIFHVHGKDCQVDFEALSTTGILHNFSMEKEGPNRPHGNDKTLWWRYRLPGLGDLDWGKIVSILYEIGYYGVINIEHEDPVWSGSEEMVKQGLLRAKRHIESFM